MEKRETMLLFATITGGTAFDGTETTTLSVGPDTGTITVGGLVCIEGTITGGEFDCDAGTNTVEVTGGGGTWGITATLFAFWFNWEVVRTGADELSTVALSL